jgi:Ca-activated chloride channel family protein
MKRGKLISAGIFALSILGGATIPVAGQQGGPVPSFKSGIDLVRISAVVRDRRGRFVPDLRVHDFDVLDDGHQRPIVDFRSDLAGVSVAVLLDVSGSMEGRLANAREAATHLLSWLELDRDEAAVFAFDTRLVQLTPFTNGLHALPQELSLMTPFGATSLNDAVAETARRLANREGKRRGIVVFSDGQDTWSKLRASEVAALASRVDVPIYVIGVVPSIDNPAADNFSVARDHSPLAGPLNELSSKTGGRTFVASTSSDRSIAARQVIDELRHQYLFAFESSGTPGWHPLEIRAHRKDLSVRARSGYIAGQSRPNSSFD